MVSRHVSNWGLFGAGLRPVADALGYVTFSGALVLRYRALDDEQLDAKIEGGTRTERASALVCRADREIQRWRAGHA